MKQALIFLLINLLQKQYVPFTRRFVYGERCHTYFSFGIWKTYHHAFSHISMVDEQNVDIQYGCSNVFSLHEKEEGVIRKPIMLLQVLFPPAPTLQRKLPALKLN